MVQLPGLAEVVVVRLPALAEGGGATTWAGRGGGGGGGVTTWAGRGGGGIVGLVEPSCFHLNQGGYCLLFFCGMCVIFF